MSAAHATGADGAGRLGHALRLAGRATTALADWTYALTQQVRAVVGPGRPDEFWRVARPDVPCAAVPVVLIPGIWEPYRFLRPLAGALHRAGHPVYPVAALGWNGADLDASAATVVEEILARDLRGVVLVAHSKGGLIGKKVLLDQRVTERVRGMVALCSPFGGSSLSFGFLGRTPLGMFAPAGRVIASLTGETSVNHRITSVSPLWDQMIPEGSRLPGARNITLGVAGHFRPLAEQSCWVVVHDEVDARASAAEQPDAAEGEPT